MQLYGRKALDYLYGSLKDLGFSQPYAVCDAMEALTVAGLKGVRLVNDAILSEFNTPQARVRIHGRETDAKYFSEGLTNRLEDAKARKEFVNNYLSDLIARPALAGYRFKTAGEKFGSGSQVYGYSANEPLAHGFIGDGSGHISRRGRFFVVKSELLLPAGGKFIDFSVAIEGKDKG